MSRFYYFCIKFKMIENLPFTISCIISSIILFQSFFIAPSVNKIITTKEASKFLRYIWPKFFLFISILSSLSLFANYYSELKNIMINYFIVISIILMLICYFITPMINKAKDNSKNKLWTILHLTTVMLTLITLVLNILLINFWQFNHNIT